MNTLTVDMTVFTLSKPAVLEYPDGRKEALYLRTLGADLPIVIHVNEVSTVNFLLFPGQEIPSDIGKQLEFSKAGLTINKIYAD